MRCTSALASLLGAITVVFATPSDLVLRWPEAAPDPFASPFAEALAQSSSAATDAAQAKQAAALQLISGMPKCGLACIEVAIQASPCSFTDTDCSCNNETITAQTTQCITASCTIKETLTTKNISDTICGKPIRDKSGLTVGSGLAGTILATVAVIIRIVSKIHIQTGTGAMMSTDLWWDDLVVVMSFCFLVAFSVITVPITRLGFARDIWTIPFENMSPLLKLMWEDEMIYVLGLGLVKISLLLTYLRFFSSNRFRQITYIIIGLNVAFILTFVALAAGQCQPISYAWKQWDGEHKGKCLPLMPIVWSSAMINIVLDFLVLGLPIYQLWKMNLNTKKKLLVMLMFGVGFVVTVTSIMRLHTIVGYGESRNFSYERVTPGVWSKVELQLSVICACMPAMRQVIRRFSPRLIGSTRGEGTTTGITTTQSGLSGRTSFWMRSLQSNMQSRTLNSGTGTIAISDVGKSVDTEHFVPLKEIHGRSTKSTKSVTEVSEISSRI